MPRNGSGTYTRGDGTFTGSTLWEQNRTAGIKIVASRHDLADQDIADAITASIAKDGQTTPTANLPMGSYKHSNVGAASARTDYARASQVQDGALSWLGTSGGSSNAYTATATPAITAYAAGQRFTFIANHTNTGASTLNVSGVAAANLRKGTGSTVLTAGDIVISRVYTAEHNGTDFVLLNPSNFLFGDLKYDSIFTITATTSDAADTGAIYIAGGGSNTTSRGAFVLLHGNENASPSAAGFAEITAGNATGAAVRVAAPNATGNVILHTNAADRWRVQEDGDFANNSTSGGNIVFDKAGSTVVTTAQSVSGTISPAIAGSIDRALALVTTAGGGAVQVGLPDPTTHVGKVFVVHNLAASSASALVSTFAGTIDGGASASVAVGATKAFLAISASAWVSLWVS